MDQNDSTDSENEERFFRRRRPSASSYDSSIDGGPPLVRARKRARWALSETSDSESDPEEHILGGRRRPVISETSDSTSESDSEVILRTRNNRLRRRPIRMSSQSSSDSGDMFGEESDNVNDVVTRPRTAASVRSLPVATQQSPPLPTLDSQLRPSSGDLTDSGDEGGEKCAICLRSIRQQEVGGPEGCDHTFCLSCLITWSETHNVCPMDRQQFTLILVRDRVDGPVTRQLPVEEKAMPVLFEDDTTFCMLCGGFDREDRMLLCDGCDRGFHLDCLTPPLEEVPEVNEWFCPTCLTWREVNAEIASRMAGLEDGAGGVVSMLRRNPSRPTNRFASTSRPLGTRTRIARNFFQNLLPSSLVAPVRAQAEDAPSTSGAQATTSSTRRKYKKRTTRKTRKTVKRRYLVKKKKVYTENDDGTVTEEIVSVRTKTVRRRRKIKKTARKRKTNRAARAKRTRVTRGSASSLVRDRLARTLGVAASSTPGQLLPEVSARKRHTPALASSFSRSLPGRPTLHIFEPRNELAPVSSGSEGEEFNDGEVGLMTRGRVGLSTRPLERRKAVELLRSAPSRPRAVPEPCEGPSDLLSSILESQTIWHSKNSQVTINIDGTVELQPNEPVDVRNAKAERVTSAAPIFPGHGFGSQRPGAMGRSTASSTQSRPDGPSGETSGPRFGALHNDREGYTHYFNNMPSRPTPFCRGGPPLRFRMPVRPQLRRIPLLPRRTSRALYDDDDVDNEPELDNKCKSDDEATACQETRPSEDDIDLYSDIEPSIVDKEGDGTEIDTDYPVLGPPPEPPAFLLNMAIENEAEPAADVYDPAEPCDSDEEMVIDEKVAEQLEAAAVVEALPMPPALPITPPPNHDSIDDCPVFSMYSTDSLEYSRKGEEERARDLADRLDENSAGHKSPPSSPRDRRGARLSFNVDVDDSQDSMQEKNNQESPPESNKGSPNDESSIKNRDTKSPRSPSSSPSREGSQRSRSNSRTSFSKDRSRKTSLPSRHGSQSPSVERLGVARRSSPRCHSTDRNEASPAPVRSRRDSDLSIISQDKIESQADNAVAVEIEGIVSDQPPRVSSGLEGLDIEQISSDMEDTEFNDAESLSSLLLSGISDISRYSSPSRKKKRRKKRKSKKEQKSEKKISKGGSEEGEIESEKEKSRKSNKRDKTDENKNESDKKKKRPSKSKSPDRRILSSQENKKPNSDAESWKKPNKKDRNYREGRKVSKDRGVSKERARSGSPPPSKEKKKSKDKKKTAKRKEIERYDVKKVVKEREDNRKDEFGRDLPARSVSLSLSRSKSPSPLRGRARLAVRRPSRSPVRRSSRSPIRRLSRSPVRRSSRSPIRRSSRSPVRRQSRSPVRRLSPSPERRPSRSPIRKGRHRKSRSHSLSPRRAKKNRRSSEREGKKSSRPRGRLSRSRRRSASRSPRRPDRPLKATRPRKSWSRSRSRSLSRSPQRIRRNFSPSPVPLQRSRDVAWSPGPNIVRGASLENLTVVLTSKDKKKKKKKKEEKRDKTTDGRRKRSGNSKEVFASGDNVLVSVNFSKSSKNNTIPIIMPSSSPTREVSKKKKRSAAEDPSRSSKKTKTSNVASKSAVDAALSTEPAHKRKILTRLTEKDAEDILNRKPVAVIDLDMSPYREQTPSPINVVVVSDSGSGDESKGPSTTATRPRSPEVTLLPTTPSSTSAAYLSATTGPKTPPEPPLKFSISKSLQMRPIANPLAEADEEAEELVDEAGAGATQMSAEAAHKGPNTPPQPRGPSTPPRGPSTPPTMGPATPQSPQSSPDAYDPFEPTKSRSASPARLSSDITADKLSLPESASQSVAGAQTLAEDTGHHAEPCDSQDVQVITVCDVASSKDVSACSAEVVEITSSQASNYNKTTPVRKSTPQPMTPIGASSLPVFSLPSPKTPNRASSVSAMVSGIQRLQHRLGSPVNKTPNSVKTTPEKLSGVKTVGKKNGPIQDATSETIEMDDSPYSPGSSEGDDLFDPPAAPPPAALPVAQPPVYKPKPKAASVKTANKFDLLFGSTGPSISPMRNGAKKPTKIVKPALPKLIADKKTTKTGAKKVAGSKMDEDQLRILDEVPSSAVELQVKDKFLKKLNRQERVVDEVKTVLKPHYAKKHVSKEEYKDILRRAVPKICHSKSGEINPSKIQQLVEAYVRKYRQKKKGGGGVQKHPKLKKTSMFS